MIPEEVILQIQNAVDIVEVIREYVPDLKRAGRVFKALCPFHREKTPSFNVNPERRIFKCFGCGKGGTVFTFLQNLENISYPEAVRMLGRRVGIRVPDSSGKPREELDRITRLYNANEIAAEFFVQTLAAHGPGETARAYLDGRGLGADVVKKFKVGLAPPGWDGLVRHARAKKLAISDFESLGLVRARSSGEGYYDYFRGRLMFPIFDAQNRIVAFGGRYLDGVADEREKDRKYVNSPESPVFVKSRILYGLNFARSAVYSEKAVVVVEGYTDAMKAHEAGVKNVVASMGTAFTPEHARMLNRLEARVVLVFDSDEAGLAAARRALPVLLAEDLELSIARLPGGKDPFDLITDEGPEVFRKALDSASDVVGFLSDAVAASEDLNSPDVQAKLIDELLDLIVLIPNRARRDLWINSIATNFKLNGSERSRLTDRMRGKNKSRHREPSHDTVSKFDPLERDLLKIIIAEPSVAVEIFAVVPPGSFRDSRLRSIAVAASELIQRADEFRLDELLVHLDDASLDDLVTDLADVHPPDADFRAMSAEVLLRYRLRDIESKLDDVKRGLRDAQLSGDDKEVEKTLKRIAELKGESERLKKGDGARI